MCSHPEVGGALHGATGVPAQPQHPRRMPFGDLGPDGGTVAGALDDVLALEGDGAIAAHGIVAQRPPVADAVGEQAERAVGRCRDTDLAAVGRNARCSASRILLRQLDDDSLGPLTKQSRKMSSLF